MSHRLSLRISIVAALFVLVGQTAFAQSPSANSWRTSPLNSFARFHGFGYSDGYHACKGNECSPKKSWLSGESFSSFYGEPTVPPPRAKWSKQPSYASYQTTQPMSALPLPYEADLNTGMTLSPMPIHESLHPIPPSPPVPMSPLNLLPIPRAPAPAASPSDLTPYDNPRPTIGREPEVVIPQLQRPQTRRVVPGTHSLMISQGVQPARR
jgi:hypothetical protein